MRCLKQMLGLILLVSMILGIMTGCSSDSPSASAPTQDVPPDQKQESSSETEKVSSEVGRAIAFGLVPEEIQGDYDKIITFRQYSAMLTNLIRIYDESCLEQWEKTISLAAESDDEMNREDGILAASYAMVMMGKVEYSGADWPFVEKVQEHMEHYGEGLTWDYPLFPDWENIAFEWNNGNYMWGGVVMCAIEKSHVSALAIYPCDFEEEGAHLSDQLTREEAISAVLRLAETEDVFADSIPLPENIDFSDSAGRIDEITALAVERKQNILAVTKSVPCTGTAYYLSNSGDDDQDGTSPETAWATLDRLKQHTFQPGDGIYFERGGVWRGAAGYFYDNIIISAYGEGDKPRIYGSPENGADAEKWELYSDENGIKIWKYKGINSECAGIVLDDGKAVAKRVYAWYDGDHYYDSTDRSTLFDMKASLSEDLYFYCDIDMGRQELPFTPDVDHLPIQIYLRCDEGNPGKIYESIEFISKTVTEDVGMIVFGPNGTLDNICVMYNAGTAVSMTEHDNFTVQNCEFGWCGTRLDNFFEPEDDEPGIWTDGNLIQLIGSNCTVRDNYIHDVDGGGIVLELGGDIAERVPFTGNIFCGNLIERCGDPFYIRNNDQDEDVAEAFGEMKIDDNYVIDAGYGWYDNSPSYINPAFYSRHSRNALNFYGEVAGDENTVSVTNNIFCRAAHSLLYLNPSGDIPFFEGNIYAQDYGKMAVETSGAQMKATWPDEMKKGFEGLSIDAGDFIVLQPE